MEQRNQKALNESLIILIMSKNFTLRMLPMKQLPSDISVSSSVSESEGNIQQYQVKMLLKQYHQNPHQSRNLLQIIKNLMLWNIQLVITEFISGLKIERVPVQKKIMIKIKNELDKQKLLIKSATNKQDVIERIQNLILADSSIFLYSLCQLSRPLTEFLEKYLIDEIEEREIHLTEVNLYIFQQSMMNQISSFIINTMGIREDYVYHEILDKSQEQMKELTYFITDQLCKILDEGRNYIEILVNQFRERAQQSIIMNKFTIIVLLSELSRNCYLVIEDLLEFTIFHYAEPEITDRFMNYTIANYDLLSLRNIRIDQQQANRLNMTQVRNPIIKQEFRSSDSIVEQCISQLRTLMSLKGKPVSVYKISYKYIIPNVDSPLNLIEEDLSLIKQSVSLFLSKSTSQPEQQNYDVKSYQEGFYIESGDPSLRFIVYMEQDSPKYKSQMDILKGIPMYQFHIIINKTFVVERDPPLDNYTFFSKTCSKKAGWGIYPIKFPNVNELLESQWLNDQLEITAMRSKCGLQERLEKQKSKQFEGQVDAMLGCFLAELTRTDNLQQFLEQFGETTVNNGCLHSLTQQIPMFSEFLSLGGFGEKALQNSLQQKTPQRQIAPISRLVISTGTSVGSALSGAIIGQFLIPIPVFGSIIGGILGGYLGNRGANSLLKNANRNKAENMGKQLQELQKSTAGYWVCTQKSIETLQINSKVFNEHMPRSLKNEQERDTKWMTVIAFTYLSLFYTTLNSIQNWDEEPSPKTQQQQWPDYFENSQRWFMSEKVNLLPCLDNLKTIIEIILKNMG